MVLLWMVNMAPTVLPQNLSPQGLKYNFQGVELFSSPGPQFGPGALFISWAHVSIASSQIIND